jgi:hypothetical protein
LGSIGVGERGRQRLGCARRLLSITAAILVGFGADTTIEAAALISTTLPSDATVRWRIGSVEALVEATLTLVPPRFDGRFPA